MALRGGKKLITVDVNPYLKFELIRQDLDYIGKNREDISRIFGDNLKTDRFEELLGYEHKKLKHLSELLEFSIIWYNYNRIIQTLTGEYL